MNKAMVSFCIILLILVVSTAIGAEDPRFDPVLGSTVFLSNGPLEPTRTEIVVPKAWRGDVSSDYDYHLVMLTPPATREKRDSLRGMGATLLEYYHYNTYLVRLPSSSIDDLHQYSAVAWHGLWHPWFKTGPAVKSLTGNLEFDIELHPSENPAHLVKWLTDRGYEPIHGKLGKNLYFVRVEIPSELLLELAQRREVHWIERHHQDIPYNANAQWVTQSFVQNYRPLWDAGITGEGQVIEINDSGVRTTHLAFVDDLVPINDFGLYPTHRKILAYIDGAPGGGAAFGDEWVNFPPYGHGTHVAGSAAGNDDTWTPKDGMAKDAKLVVSDVGMANGSLNTLPPYWAFTAGYDAGGATIHNASWGSDSEGDYWLNDKSGDQYMWEFQDRLACMAAGNNPPNFKISTPACAKSVICVGASRNGTTGNQLAFFTARGPTSDGRIAPTLLTPGDNVSSCSNNSDVGYALSGGTSMASPIAAGNAALVRQYFMEGYYPTGSPTQGNEFTPLGSLLKAVLIAAGRNAVTYEPINDRTGWGFVVLDDALYLGERSRKIWAHQDTLAEGAQESWDLTVESGAEFKVVLAWSDRQGDTGGNQSLPRLKNDLDLEVEGPGGLFLGNRFSGGESVTGGSEDRLNTSEVVWLRTPAAGTYTVRVNYYTSPLDDEQPYALVAVGEGVVEVGGDVEPPTIPQNVQLTSDGMLSWDASTDNVGVQGYRVYRTTEAYFETTGMTSLGSTAGTTYSVPGSVGDPATNYYFRITAYDSAQNESGASETVGEHDYELEDGS